MSMKDYNGYTNYETWCCNLWIMNNPTDEGMIIELVYKTDRKTMLLAEMLQDLIRENNPLKNDSNMFSDLMGAVISEINFVELAENYINDYAPIKDCKGKF